MSKDQSTHLDMNTLTTYKKSLRVDQTNAENMLWSHLRNRKMDNFKFRRQHVLQGYIVDFACLEKKLIIELDGGQHGEQQQYDIVRTRKLEKNGFKVLRFWNFEVLRDVKRVLKLIYEALTETITIG